MDDRFDWQVVLQLAVKGAKGVEGDLNRVLNVTRQLEKEGRVTEQTLDSTQRAVVRAGSSASTAAGGGVKQLETNLVSTRYALYDVSTTAFATSAALTAIGAASLVASAQMESAFTGVQRTLDPSYTNVEGLRDSLTQLSREIPMSFADLSNIAMLGNQLGIAGDSVDEFTTTVAQFSAVTGMSVDEVSLALGQLGNLMGVPADQFSNLGSSIALVGVNSAATEQQIISVARELAPTAASAGFTADQVIGLSGALASLKVPPERSRSTILQFFETLNMAVANGGKDLDNFAAVVGVTTGQLEQMVRSGQGEDIFRGFISNTAASDTVEVTQALEELGLAGLRTNPTIRALSQNTGLLDQAFADASRGFAENAELQRQFAFVTDDLASRWQLFMNAVMEVTAALGNSFAPAAVFALDAASGLLTALAGFAASPVGSFMMQLAGVIGGVVAAFTALIGIMALSGASLFAINFALRQLAISGGTAGGRMIALAGSLGLVKYGADGATGATLSFSGALRALGAATIVIGLIQLLVTVLTDLAGTAINVGNVIAWVGDNISGFGGVVLGAVNGILNAMNPLLSMLGLFGITQFPKEVGTALSKIGNDMKRWGEQQKRVNDEVAKTPEMPPWANWDTYAPPPMPDIGPMMDYGDAVNDAADATNNLGEASDTAIKEVRTLVDYANDLSSVWDRAFEIRFSGQQTMDAIVESFMKMRETTEEAQRNIRSLKADIQGLNADLSIQQYFLGIAKQYKDAQRVEAIEANIAKIRDDLAKKTDDLSTEQGKNSRVLSGNSRAAIDNRRQLENLVRQYQAHLAALAANGMGSDELMRRTEELRQEFIRQGVQLGFSRAELARYAAAFDDVTLAIQRVPRNITVKADTNPAIQALNELEERMRTVTGPGMQALDAYDARLRDIGGRTYGGGNVAPPNLGSSPDIVEAMAKIDYYAAALNSLSTRRPVPMQALDSAEMSLVWWRNRLTQLRGWEEGGYTGPGASNQPAGIVHRGEYVVPKKYVDQRTGLPKEDALGRLQRGVRGNVGYQSGGFVSGSRGRMVTDLSPMSIQQLAQAMNKYLVVDGRVVASTAANQYAKSTARGEY